MATANSLAQLAYYGDWGAVVAYSSLHALRGWAIPPLEKRVVLRQPFGDDMLHPTIP